MAVKKTTAAYLARRADILRAAGEVFYELGYHAASMEKIADRAGILKPALYYYVRSKEDLLFELAAGEQSVAFIDQFVELDHTLADQDAATQAGGADHPLGRIRQVGAAKGASRHRA